MLYRVHLGMSGIRSVMIGPAHKEAHYYDKTKNTSTVKPPPFVQQ